MVEANPTYHDDFSSYGNLYGAELETRNEPLWNGGDPWYSNQMNTGTCVRHSLAKALFSFSYGSMQLNVSPEDLLDLLLMARQDKGASNANPLDWDGKVLVYRHRTTHAIYDCTVSVERSNFRDGNMIGVDMRKVLPNKRQNRNPEMHVMYLSKGDSKKCCYNSWGNSDKKIIIESNITANYFRARWKKIVKRNYGGPDK